MRNDRHVFAVTIAGILLLGPTGLTAKSPDLKGWTLDTEPIQAVRAVTDYLPLSDQGNRKGWVRYEPMSDEFEGKMLDPDKWWPRNPKWLGRQPAFFWDRNVSVNEGKLHLMMRREESPEAPKNKGYHTYTSAAVKSKGTVKYGYFEVKARPMNSHGSSSFWFYENEPEMWTEIDVFEIGGGAPGFEKKYNMNVHVFRTPTETEHWSKHGQWESPERLADDYHVYGLEWDQDRICWYFDGVPVRWVENTHWHQGLTLNFDSETMPEWFGLPRDGGLPSTYSIEYVRAWKRDGDSGVVETCNKVRDAMEAVFGTDRGLIEHTLKVHGYACAIQWAEGGNEMVVRTAALLHDIGIPMARQVHGSSAGQYQEKEGPPIAETVLKQTGIATSKIEHICGIVANHHSARDKPIVDTLEFKIVWDADWLVNLPGRASKMEREQLEETIEKTFRTHRGRELARSLMLK